jgi:hypothetical protein
MLYPIVSWLHHGFIPHSSGTAGAEKCGVSGLGQGRFNVRLLLLGDIMRGITCGVLKNGYFSCGFVGFKRGLMMVKWWLNGG